jgi:phage tail-like protein
VDDQSGRLTIYLGSTVEQTVSLEKAVLTIGRTPAADITLDHPMVSRQHAEISLGADGLMLTDVGSSNGTFMADQRLPANQPLLISAGASWRIGPYVFVYEIESNEDAFADLPGEYEKLNEAEAHRETGKFAEVGPVVLKPPRNTFAAALPPGPSSAYLDFLPDIFRDDEFLGRFLLIFESVWEPLEQRQDHLHRYFDPKTAPSSFLPWLASWMDLPRMANWPEPVVRNLISEAADLNRWRGSRYGLSRLLEAATGAVVSIREDPARPYVFAIRVETRSESELSDENIRQLIQRYKPAHAGFVLEVVRQ